MDAQTMIAIAAISAGATVICAIASGIEIFKHFKQKKVQFTYQTQRSDFPKIVQKVWIYGITALSFLFTAFIVGVALPYAATTKDETGEFLAVLVFMGIVLGFLPYVAFQLGRAYGKKH